MNNTPTSQRLYSLDALRGFDMFWIMGGEDIVHEFMKASKHPAAIWMATQLSHVAWNGFRFYDLIFPLFLFISGVSTPYSIGREIDKGVENQKILLRIIKRGLILVLLGIIYNNGLQIQALSHIRFPSVLGRIGLAYMFACIIYLYASQRWQYVWFGGILIGYWLMLKFNSAPNFSIGDLSMEGNFASWLDRTILPGRLHLKIHDPEGLFSTLPAICTGLLGIFAGNFLKNELTKTPIQKAAYLALAGIVCLIVGATWDMFFPINKNLWTSSFMLYAGGCSLILLAIFYFIIDVMEYKRWAFFFTVIGMNSILIYLSVKFIDWYYTAEGLFRWFAQLFGEHYYEVAIMACIIAIKWLFLLFMFRKKLFLRV
jgi:predicted acyltransferase